MTMKLSRTHLQISDRVKALSKSNLGGQSKLSRDNDPPRNPGQGRGGTEAQTYEYFGGTPVFVKEKYLAKVLDTRMVV